MIDHDGNLYPYKEARANHLEAIAKAEIYVIGRKYEKIHTRARTIAITCIVIIYAVYLIGGVL